MRTGGLIALARTLLADAVRSLGLIVAEACAGLADIIEPAREWPIRLWDRDHDPRSENEERP